MKTQNDQQKKEYQIKSPKWIENSVVKTYQDIEEAVTTGYKAIEEKFVETFLEEKKK